jgi:hypothetical protein
VARELRKIRISVPIIFVTGYADADALFEADQGSVVPKPFTRLELAQKRSIALCADTTHRRRLLVRCNHTITHEI